MNKPEDSKETKQEKSKKFSIFSLFAILAAFGLFLAFFLPMLKLNISTEEFTAYKKEFDSKYDSLQKKLDEAKKASEAANVSYSDESTVDVKEFSPFFEKYGILLPKVEEIKVKDIKKFKEIADALFVVLENGSPKSLYDFSKALEKNKDLISNVENAEILVRNISVMSKSLKWLSVGIPIIGGLLVLFIIISGFGKFNALFLILTFIPGFAFALFGAVSLFVLPNLSEVFTTLNMEKYVIIPEKILDFIGGLTAGSGMILMFVSGCLMFVISLFGVSRKNFPIVYTFYLICALVLGFLVLNVTNVI